MSRTTAVIVILLLAPMLPGCAGDGEKMPVTTREVCLGVMLEALTLETAHVARQLKQAGTAEGREALEERSRELRRDFEKYSAIRSEEFELPEPITLIGRINGDNIYFLRQSRSGPFYHPVAITQTIEPGVRYKFKVYPLCRRWYPFPDQYVWIAHVERADVVSIAEYFGIRELTEVYISSKDQRLSSSDPEVLKKMIAFLEALPYEEDPDRLVVDENAVKWSVQLVKEKIVLGRLDIRGSMLCSPRATTDSLRKEGELIQFIQKLSKEMRKKSNAEQSGH